MRKTVRVTGQPVCRGGYALVLFVLASFVLFAFAAMVIDLGLARHTQAQMNSAVETAALEGLRFRDEIPDEWLSNPVMLAELEAVSGASPAFPQDDSVAWQVWRDSVRRAIAAGQVRLVFDDDLNATNGDSLQLGAGPVITFSDGIALPGTAFRASELMSIPANPVYDPVLQSNLTDDQTGDMVAGNFTVAANHNEADDYSRADFTPTTRGQAFLVRMRRTNEAIDAGLGVGSNAPPVPYLFGRGTVADPDTKANGIPIRSTAISDASPAMSVGAARPAALEIPGAVPFVLRRSQWNLLAAGISTTATVSAAGDISLAGISVTGTQGEGIVVTASGQSVARSLGFQVALDAPAAAHTFVTQMLANSAHPASGSVAGYIPIVGDLSSVAADRIVGFAYVDSLSNAGGGQFNFTKRSNRIAASNASVAVMASLDPAVVAGVFAEHALVDDKLLTAALVR